MLYVAGLDEAGRGAWAGPVVAAAVILPPDPQVTSRLAEVCDSKLLSPEERALCRIEIEAAALCWAVGSASPREIDRINILNATRLAMRRALAALCVSPQALLIDALLLQQVDLPQTAIIKGDQISLSVAAASVLAKTERDRMMTRMDRRHPGYGFGRHKGYGTPHHSLALQVLGVCAIHRHTYRPVAACEEME